MAEKLQYSANFKRNYVAMFAFMLFFLMIIGELVITISIPRFVNRENAFADQIRKRELLLRFDAARNICRSIPEKDENIKLEKKLLSDTLDYLAIYLRRESDRLTPQDVNELDPLVTELFKIASKLKEGESFSQESKLDPSNYISHTISRIMDEKHE
jgi:hypothetical protein